MKIWTTEGLKAFLDQDMPVKTIAEGMIKTAFLREALPHDIAILPFDDDYLDFLTEKKRRGLNNPVVFISTEPTLIQENLPSYNALLIDLKRSGKADVRNTLSFLSRLWSEATRPAPPVPRETITEEPRRDKPEDDPETIRGIIDYLIKEGISIIVSFLILEAGSAVTVRGCCKIREIRDNRLLLIRFRPATIIRGLKEGLSVKAVLPARTSYEGNLNILWVGEEEALTTIPDKLFIERRRFLRIEPSPERPVLLYILKHDEPTIPIQVTDISQRGIGFITGRDFNINEIYPLSIVFPDGDPVVSYGVIRFKRVEKVPQKAQDETFRYGVELFTHSKDEEKIAEYVMKREIEIIQLLED